MARFDPDWSPSDWQRYYNGTVVRRPDIGNLCVAKEFETTRLYLYDPSEALGHWFPYSAMRWEHLRRPKLGWLVKGNLAAYMTALPARNPTKGIGNVNTKMFVHPWVRSVAQSDNHVVAKIKTVSPVCWNFAKFADKHSPLPLHRAVDMLNESGNFATCLASVTFLLSRNEKDNYDIWRGPSVIGEITPAHDVLMRPGFEDYLSQLENIDG